MRHLIVFSLSLLVSSCAYNYKIGVPENSLQVETSTLISSFNFDISEIDGQPFKEKFNFSAVGKNTIILPAGFHTIKFRYCDCNLNYQNWTEGENFVSEHMEPGKKYKMNVSPVGKGYVRFSITEVQP